MPCTSWGINGQASWGRLPRGTAGFQSGWPMRASTPELCAAHLERRWYGGGTCLQKRLLVQSRLPACPRVLGRGLQVGVLPVCVEQEWGRLGGRARVRRGLPCPVFWLLPPRDHRWAVDTSRSLWTLTGHHISLDGEARSQGQVAGSRWQSLDCSFMGHRSPVSGP